jgi:hypothetical protein
MLIKIYYNNTDITDKFCSLFLVKYVIYIKHDVIFSKFFDNSEQEKITIKFGNEIIELQNKRNHDRIILVLPILNNDNKIKYKEWHEYYEKIYGKKVENTVDLNKFNWFYWDSPIGKDIPINILYRLNMDGGYVSKYPDNLEYNKFNSYKFNCINELHTPYNSSSQNKKINHPEALLGEKGFFVKRCIDNELFKKEKLEVIRSEISVWEEIDCKWYFQSTGSGIFIDLDSDKTSICQNRYNFFKKLLFEKDIKYLRRCYSVPQLIVIRKINEIIMEKSFKYDTNIVSIMNSKNVKTLILTHSWDYGNQNLVQLVNL